MVKYSENAQKIYERLYLRRDPRNDEVIETIDECHKRVADYVGSNDDERKAFKWVLDEQIFRPNTPTMLNAGVNPDKSLMACYVFGLEDSMDSIIDMWATCARIYEQGGGAGIPIYKLREKGSPIRRGGFASGPVSYMKVIQAISEQVKSGGTNRRAANLVALRYDHPDILDFVKCKSENDLSAMNISVVVDDWFMSQVENGDFYSTVELVSPNKRFPTNKTLTVGEIWRAICENAWKTGDPGLLFYDHMNRTNPTPSTGEYVCCNPCGEVVGKEWTCCCLGHINLNKCLDGSRFDFSKLERYVHIGVTFLNRVIDKSSYPHPKFEERMKLERPIGLGIMGFADILYKLRIPYDSPEAISLFSEICKCLTQSAFKASRNYAYIVFNENGGCHPLSKLFETIGQEGVEDFRRYLRHYGVESDDLFFANTSVTCLAPTGSTSLSADASYSFEPKFALVWSKKLVDTGEELLFVDEIFREACREYGIELTDKLIEKIANNHGSIQGLSEFPDEMQRIFKVAHDINPDMRVAMQAAGQRWITQSISSTVNLPNAATVDDVSKIYLLAWKNGLKGITVYRDGCKADQPVKFGGNKSKTKEGDGMEKVVMLNGRRPQIREGKTVEISTPRGNLYITGNFVDGKLMEIFLSMGRQGSWENVLLNTVGRLISKMLQYNMPLDDLIDTLQGCGGDPFWANINGRSYQANGIIDLVSIVIQQVFVGSDAKVMEVVDVPKEDMRIKGERCDADECPQCGRRTLRKVSGCRGGVCSSLDCGYSSCA